MTKEDEARLSEIRVRAKELDARFEAKEERFDSFLLRLLDEARHDLALVQEARAAELALRLALRARVEALLSDHHGRCDECSADGPCAFAAPFYAEAAIRARAETPPVAPGEVKP